GTADLLLVVGGFLLQLGGLDGDPGQALEAAQQGEGRFWVRDRGDVVRHRRPERGGVNAVAAAEVVDDADDPGRALVAGALQLHLLDQLFAGGEAGDWHRQGGGGLRGP